MDNTFKTTEKSFLAGIAAALGFRQFSLILAMPLLAIYANTLEGATSALIGLAVGIYGLLQAVFQLPYGALSDKIGRKPVILTGIIQLSAGLFLAGIADNIYILIAARALQGSGAIMAAAYSWISDTIDESRRNRAMSIVGISFGIAGTAAFIGASLLNKIFTVSHIFFLCAVLSMITWFYIVLFIKEDQTERKSRKKEKIQLSRLNKDFIKVSLGGFFVNYSMVSVFIIIPQFLDRTIGSSEMWKLFLPATILGIISMRISAIFADNGHEKSIVILSFSAVGISALSFMTQSTYLNGAGLILYFAGYMCLVTLFPAAATKFAPKDGTGSVTGIFNTIQFLGSFAGGALTGVLAGIGKTQAAAALLILCVITAAAAVSIKSFTANKQEIEN